MEQRQAVREFAELINAHDVEGMLAAMTADHRFVDAQGAEVTGPEPLRAAWRGYFSLVPDYWVRLDAVAAEEGVVLACGFAGGTYLEAWQAPAAWRAIVREGRIALWQVYADNQPLRELIARGV